MKLRPRPQGHGSLFERTKLLSIQALRQRINTLKEKLESDSELRQREPVVAALCRQLVADMLEAAEMAEAELRGVGGLRSDLVSQPVVITELACPVPGCTRSGNLALQSLCEDHYDELPEAVRENLSGMRRRPRREA